MNYKNSIVFVGGIHGCGKTTISQHIAVLLRAAHVTASELIRTAGSVEPTFRTDVDKKVTQADINQALLLRSLHDYRTRCNRAVILLDGHFSLLDRLGAVTRIPVEVYEAIAPVAVLLIEADARVIQKRLTKRDGALCPWKRSHYWQITSESKRMK